LLSVVSTPFPPCAPVIRFLIFWVRRMWFFFWIFLPLLENPVCCPKVPFLAIDPRKMDPLRHGTFEFIFGFVSGEPGIHLMAVLPFFSCREGAPFSCTGCPVAFFHVDLSARCGSIRAILWSLNSLGPVHYFHSYRRPLVRRSLKP